MDQRQNYFIRVSVTEKVVTKNHVASEMLLEYVGTT